MLNGRRWVRSVLVLSGVLALTGCMFLAFGGFEVPATLSLFSNHRGAVNAIVGLVEAGRVGEALDNLDSLHGATIALRADLQGLRFEGTHDTLTDPAEVPAGAYRAHVETEGPVFVKAFDLTGEQVGRSIFLLITGEASGGASALFNAPGGKLMFEFSNIREPVVFELERIN